MLCFQQWNEFVYIQMLDRVAVQVKITNGFYGSFEPNNRGQFGDPLVKGIPVSGFFYVKR